MDQSRGFPTPSLVINIYSKRGARAADRVAVFEDHHVKSFEFNFNESPLLFKKIIIIIPVPWVSSSSCVQWSMYISDDAGDD